MKRLIFLLALPACGPIPGIEVTGTVVNPKIDVSPTPDPSYSPSGTDCAGMQTLPNGHCIDGKNTTTRLSYEDALADCDSKGKKMCSTVDMILACNVGETLNYVDMWSKGPDLANVVNTSKTNVIKGTDCSQREFAVRTKYGHNYVQQNYYCCKGDL